MCWDCDNNTKGDPYKNYRHGAVEVDDFEDEIPYRHPKRKKKAKKARGCPANDFGPHIYVWTTEFFCPSGHFDEWIFRVEKEFHEKNGFCRREYKTCVGCYRRVKSRYTEGMAKRIAKMGWYKANYGER